LVPDREGQLKVVLVGVSSLDDPFALAKLPAVLPSGKYLVDNTLTEKQSNELALGWALGTYRFTRYKSYSAPVPELVVPATANRLWLEGMVEAVGMGRDLINTPAEDMGPAELAAAAAAIAQRFGAAYREIVGEELLSANYPSIHTVGRASSREPRLVDFTWGNPKHPKVTLVGKGVCFDTGGLDLKPAEAMKLMKKDMGGAATVLALAFCVMQLKLPVRLRVLIPAVENSVSGNAFRPMDVIRTRKGLTVEVGNTDAEGRLILCDALAEADAESPELLIDIATLTGAARVALGTGLPALFTNSDALAAQLLTHAETSSDPMWRMPLHAPYRRMLDSKVANLNNVSNGPYAGAITAALFLQEFVSPKTPWVHLDSMAYHVEPSPGRPVGGDVLGVKALLSYLEARYPAA
jgi:leucyl aminopeptidase